MADVFYKAKVTAPSGNTVRLRSLPTTNAKVIEMIPIDEEVDVIEEINDEWCFISDSGVTGYMMKKFLARVEEEKKEDKPGYIFVSAEALEDLRECLSAALTIVDEILDEINVG